MTAKVFFAWESERDRWSQERQRERDLNLINNEVQRLHLVIKDHGVCASHKHVYNGSRQTWCSHRVSSLSINRPSQTWLSGLTAYNWDLNYWQWGNWNQWLNTRSLILSDPQWSPVEHCSGWFTSVQKLSVFAFAAQKLNVTANAGFSVNILMWTVLAVLVTWNYGVKSRY